MRKWYKLKNNLENIKLDSEIRQATRYEYKMESLFNSLFYINIENKKDVLLNVKMIAIKKYESKKIESCNPRLVVGEEYPASFDILVENLELASNDFITKYFYNVSNVYLKIIRDEDT